MDNLKYMTFAVDFDGTCVKHKFPAVGESIGAENVLRRLVAAGHRLILNTVRSDQYLQPAVDWFKQHNLPLYGVNENPDQKQWSETPSPKVYCHHYIDDLALGAPLVRAENELPYIDWEAMENLLDQVGAFKNA